MLTISSIGQGSTASSTPYHQWGVLVTPRSSSSGPIALFPFHCSLIALEDQIRIDDHHQHLHHTHQQVCGPFLSTSTCHKLLFLLSLLIQDQHYWQPNSLSYYPTLFVSLELGEWIIRFSYLIPFNYLEIILL